MSSKTPIEPARLVLAGVPRINFYQGGPRAPEDDPFPACVRAFLEYRGEDLGYRARNAAHSANADPWHDVHVYAMGVSGAAFRVGFDPANWRFGPGEFLGAVVDPFGGCRRALAAVGYGCEILLRRDFSRAHGVPQEQDYDEADFRDRIVQSIRDQGRPVIAFGVIGPPECCLITGYDDGGDVLIGWNCFQDSPEFSAGIECEPMGQTTGQFRKRGWFADTPGIILIGEPQPRPAPRDVLREALRAGLECMRTPYLRGVAIGQAAYTLWADALLKDALFPADDPDTLRQRYNVHHGNAGALAESRAWGAWFLHGMSDEVPEAAEELRAAAKCFDAIHDLVWAIWEFTNMGRSGHISTDEGARKFAEHGTRRRIVPLIRLARKEDAGAARHLAQALELLGDTGAGGEHRRAVLEGVPKIGYHLHLNPLSGSLYAVMKYLGATCDYDYLVAATGAAFRRLWNRDDGGNVDLMYFAPEPHERAGRALGYELEPVARDRDRMIAALKESVARGRPAIGFGIIGPPEAEIVAGYDEDGDVLIGYSYFQDQPDPIGPEELEPSGYFRRANWFDRLAKGAPYGLLVLGDKMRWHEPVKREVLIDTLKWAIDLERTPKRANLPDHVSGLAAVEAWASALEVDADYPPGDMQVMGTRVMVYADQCVMLDDHRSAGPFLRGMAEAAPEAAELLKAAADLFTQIADQGRFLWPWASTDWGAAVKALENPQTRRDLARHVRAAGKIEARAVAKLEEALAILTKA